MILRIWHGYTTHANADTLSFAYETAKTQSLSQRAQRNFISTGIFASFA